jgi:radical SAM protein with 4Fe4S-binding SPASM domain
MANSRCGMVVKKIRWTSVVTEPYIENKGETYEKHHSFSDFYSSNSSGKINAQKKRVIKLITDYLSHDFESSKNTIYRNILNDLTSQVSKYGFKITQFIADEMDTIDDGDIPRYLFHRYRYDIYPKEKLIDSSPPYLQIEPTSVCNYRCVFCYQTDNEFTQKKNGFMGSMSLDTYKLIIDQAEDNIEFISLASRGEPLICKELPKMLEYSIGKFMNLKINTNAFLLTESLCHSLLNGAIKTLVFSADAAEEPLYSKMRVNGKLKRVIENIELFNKIKETQYKDSKIITRVSGVKFSDKQNMYSMKKTWGNLVDQISFVKYNPWENIYKSAVNEINEPCSDLWRRMFIWYDGSVNPCDSDYKSILKISNISEDNNIGSIWGGAIYKNMRKNHITHLRNTLEPCRRCSVV